MRDKWSTISRFAGNSRLFFDQLFTCELCLEPTGDKSGICAECYNRLPFSGLACPQCSEPVSTEGRCGRCQRKPPGYDYSYCSLNYSHPLPHWLHRCKDRRDRRQIERFLQLMLDAPPVLSIAPDYLTCIPASRRRLFQRGFNLSAELTLALSAQMKIPILNNALIKTHHTEQRGAGRKVRAQTTALSVRNTVPHGAHILIIDDVMTTGSTLDEAARLLKQKGAAIVGGWCLARTPKSF
ncbi:MAG: ComF family protein [Thalassolituus sp.]